MENHPWSTNLVTINHAVRSPYYGLIIINIDLLTHSPTYTQQHVYICLEILSQNIFVQYVPVKKNTLWKMNVSQWTKLHLAFCQFIYKWINSLLTVQNIHIKYDFHYLSEALFFCLTVYIHDLHVFEETHERRAFFTFTVFFFSPFFIVICSLLLWYIFRLLLIHPRKNKTLSYAC